MIAKDAYEAAASALTKYCAQETDLEPNVIDGGYPFTVVYTMKPSLYESDTDDAGTLTVEVGLETTVKNTLRFDMYAADLKKLIKLTEQTGRFFYHAFAEERLTN